MAIPHRTQDFGPVKTKTRSRFAAKPGSLKPDHFLRRFAYRFISLGATALKSCRKTTLRLDFNSCSNGLETEQALVPPRPYGRILTTQHISTSLAPSDLTAGLNALQAVGVVQFVTVSQQCQWLGEQVTDLNHLTLAIRAVFCHSFSERTALLSYLSDLRSVFPSSVILDGFARWHNLVVCQPEAPPGKTV